MPSPLSGSLGKDGTWATQQVWNRQAANFLHTITREAAQETSVLRIDLIIACDSDGPQESMTCASDQCGLVTVLCKRLADNNGRLDPLSLSNAFAMACAASPPTTFPPLLPGASHFLVSYFMHISTNRFKSIDRHCVALKYIYSRV